MAAYRSYEMFVRSTTGTDSVTAAEISPTLLPLLGVNVFIGRDLNEQDDQPGATPVALISFQFWKQRYSVMPG